MAEEFDKSEDATPSKLEDARKKGQVGKSAEFSSMGGLLLSLLAFCILLPEIGRSLERLVTQWMFGAHALAEDPGLMLASLVQFASELVVFVLPVILLGAVASIASTVLHIGPVFSLHPVSPDFSRLNPATGLKKVFSLRSLVEILKLVVKLSIFGAAAFYIWQSSMAMAVQSGSVSFESMLQSLRHVAVKVILVLLAIYFCFSLFDLWYSKREFARQMRMSKRDVKDEAKRREGNPEIKSKRRRVYSDLVKKFSSLASVKDADVIITNPTHVAVALQYRPKKMALPIVLAKGKGHFALLIRKKASRAGVPVVRIPALARTLLAEIDVDAPISLAHRRDVAEVYRGVINRPGCKVYS